MSIITRGGKSVFTVGTSKDSDVMHYFTPEVMKNWSGFRAKCGAHISSSRVSIGSLSNTFCMSCWELMGMTAPEQQESPEKAKGARKKKSPRSEGQRTLF